jgi:hypothetical protein
MFTLPADAIRNLSRLHLPAKTLGPQSIRKKSELVVGGDVIWKPVNKQAALVIAKAPWYCKPPEGGKTNETQYRSVGDGIRRYNASVKTENDRLPRRKRKGAHRSGFSKSKNRPPKTDAETAVHKMEAQEKHHREGIQANQSDIFQRVAVNASILRTACLLALECGVISGTECSEAISSIEGLEGSFPKR